MDGRSELLEEMQKKHNELSSKQDEMLRKENSEELNSLTSKVMDYERKLDNTVMLQKHAAEQKDVVSQQYKKQLDLLTEQVNKLKNMTKNRDLEEYKSFLEKEKQNANKQKEGSEHQKTKFEELQETLNNKTKAKKQEQLLSSVQQQNIKQIEEFDNYNKQIDNQVSEMSKKSESEKAMSDKNKEIEKQFKELAKAKMDINIQKKELQSKNENNADAQKKLEELEMKEKQLGKQEQTLEQTKKELKKEQDKRIEDFKNQIMKQNQDNQKKIEESRSVKEEHEKNMQVIEDSLKKRKRRRVLTKKQDNKYELLKAQKPKSEIKAR
jgi:hypothetical protein